MSSKGKSGGPPRTRSKGGGKQDGSTPSAPRKAPAGKGNAYAAKAAAKAKTLGKGGAASSSSSVGPPTGYVGPKAATPSGPGSPDAPSSPLIPVPIDPWQSNGPWKRSATIGVSFDSLPVTSATVPTGELVATILQYADEIVAAIPTAAHLPALGPGGLIAVNPFPDETVDEYL